MCVVRLKLVSCAIVVTLSFGGCNLAEPDSANQIDIEDVVYWPTREAKLTSDQIGGVDAGAVFCVFEHKPERTPIAIVWFDGPYQSRGGGSQSSPKSASSAYRTVSLEENRKLQIDCYKANEPDRPLEFKIDGKQYDLEEGNFFLVSTHDERIRVHQTRRSLEGMQFKRETIVETAKSDREIKDFYTSVASDNGKAKSN
jgi:hypothetical protein